MVDQPMTDRGRPLVLAGRVCYGLAVAGVALGWLWGHLWYGGGEAAAFVWLYSIPIGLSVAFVCVFAGRVLIGIGRDSRLRARGKRPRVP